MDIQWDSPATLSRVTEFETTDETMEEPVARGSLRELVAQVLAMPADAQAGLLIRSAGPGWSRDYDSNAIRELAAREEFFSG